MTSFDRILPALAQVMAARWDDLEPLLPIFVNRDLNGRVRLFLDATLEPTEEGEQWRKLQNLANAVHANLSPHVGEPGQIFDFKDSLLDLIKTSTTYPLSDQLGNILPNVYVVDRLAQEATWETISSDISTIPRVVFYSIKGGVGRSTALAASAWALAESGQRVLVLDLDLESPGLSTSLLPTSRQPAYGITDWLVEDLVNNGDAILDQMHASLGSQQRGGELIVVPSHGDNPGEYVSKLGRVWMPGFTADGQRQTWSERLLRMIQQLEAKHQPTIVLIDSRAGIDEVASACVTDLGAKLIYLFALDSLQTWQGYRILFEHWRLHGVAPIIRERLQVVGALIPTWGDGAFTQATRQLRENAYSLFSGSLYDEAWPEADEDADGLSSPPADLFNFDLPDRTAPHNPCAIGWNQAFAAIESLHDRLQSTDPDQIKLVFGSLLTDLQVIIGDNQ
jgi:CobQ/CobB/MinD/ParA nucleotide binding domain